KNDTLVQKTTTSGNEHSYTTTMNLSSKGILGTSEIREGTRTEVSHTEEWNRTTNEAMIGFTHTHGFESAPSPLDAFAGIFAYTDENPLSMFNSSQRETYISYLTSTTLTPNYTYVITITDEEAWASRFANVKEDRETYDRLTKEYKGNGFSYHKAQELALLELYGAFINLYRSSNSGNLDFKPLSRLPNPDPHSKNKYLTAEKPCI